jgi:hypothetical protein
VKYRDFELLIRRLKLNKLSRSIMETASAILVRENLLDVLQLISYAMRLPEMPDDLLCIHSLDFEGLVAEDHGHILENQ